MFNTFFPLIPKPQSLNFKFNLDKLNFEELLKKRKRPTNNIIKIRNKV